MIKLSSKHLSSLCFLSCVSIAIIVLLRTSFLSIDRLHIQNNHDPFLDRATSFVPVLHGFSRASQSLIQEALENQYIINPNVLDDDLKKNRHSQQSEKEVVESAPNDETLLVPVAVGDDKKLMLPSCDGRRIYMYELPPKFNTLILQQCDYKIAPWLNFCPHFINNGFGKMVDDDENWPNWYQTDPYMLEVIFHSRMANYTCRTHDPAQADAFFIPYYSGLDALNYLYGKKRKQRAIQGVKLLNWLMQENGGKNWVRHGGHDHFIVMGRTAWDFTRVLPTREVSVAKIQKNSMARYLKDAVPSKARNRVEEEEEEEEEEETEEGAWGTSFANLPAMANVTALFFEKRPWRWIEQAIPYPTGFHPKSMRQLREWQDRVREAKRTFLFAFVGAARTEESAAASSSELISLRQAALQQCREASQEVSDTFLDHRGCTLLDCSKIKCAHDPVRIAERLLMAEFCLQPPGDTVTRRSTFDGMLSGCIPVFFSNDSAYTQYTWHLPVEDVSSYSVFVPAAQLHQVQPLLASISAQRRRRMRSFIVEQLIPRVIYASPELGAAHPIFKDAFQLSLDGLLDRVADKKKTTWPEQF